jgi:hypothetical protein
LSPDLVRPDANVGNINDASIPCSSKRATRLTGSPYSGHWPAAHLRRSKPATATGSNVGFAM